MENFNFLGKYLWSLKKDLLKAFMWNMLYLIYLKGIIYGIISISSMEIKKHVENKVEETYQNSIKIELSWKKLKKITKNILDLMLNIIVFIFHLDYRTSDILKYELLKNNILNKREKRGELINYFNRVNLMMALFFYTFIIGYGYDETSILILLFFVLRSLYRSFEIIHAFVKDVTKSEDNKKSDLKKHDRLSLVIRSYIEIIILNAVVYKILFKLYGGLEPFIHSLGIVSFGDFSFVRMSILLENAINIVQSGENFDIISSISQLRIHQYYLGNLVMISQILATLSLILLSLAIYTGYKET